MTKKRPRRALLVASVAGGHGDVAFAARAARALLEEPDVLLAVCLVKQSAGSGARALAALVAAAGIGRDDGGRVVALRLLLRQNEGAIPEDLVAASALLAPSAARLLGEGATFEPDVVLQCPLKVFTSGAAAAAAAGMRGPGDGVQCPLKVFTSGAAAAAAAGMRGPGDGAARLVTVREFGHHPFACLSRPERDGDLDLAAGLADDELGVFGGIAAERSGGDGGELDAALAAAQIASHASLCVGHFRSSKGAKAFGRAVAYLAAMSGGGGGGDGVLGAALAALFPRDLEGDVLAGFADHPLVEGAPACVDGALRFSLRGGRGGGVAVPIRDLPSLGLSSRAFVGLLARARFAVVTGDASLNEALASGVPFCYSVEPHKAALASSLRQLASAGGGGNACDGAADVLNFWQLLDGTGGSWPLLQQRGPAGLRDSFAIWNGAVLRSRGCLEERLRAVVLS